MGEDVLLALGMSPSIAAGAEVADNQHLTPSRPAIKSGASQLGPPSPVSAQRFTHLQQNDQKQAEPAYESTIRQTSMGIRPSSASIPMQNLVRPLGSGADRSPSPSNNNNSPHSNVSQQPMLSNRGGSERQSDASPGPQIEIHMGSGGANSRKGGADSIQAYEYDPEAYD